MIRFLLSAALFIAMPGMLHAQSVTDAFRYSQRDIGTGARAIGLAGVGTAGIDDISALQTNPAGLGYYRTSEATGTLAIGSTTTMRRTSSAMAPRRSRRPQARFGRKCGIRLASADGSRSSVFAAAYNQTASFDRTLAFSGTTDQSTIGYQFLFASEGSPFVPLTVDDFDEQGRPFVSSDNADPIFAAYFGGLVNLFEDDQGFFLRQAAADGLAVRQQSEGRERGAMHDLSFGGAVEAAPGVMVGVGVNLAVGSYEAERRFEEDGCRRPSGCSMTTSSLSTGWTGSGSRRRGTTRASRPICWASAEGSACRSSPKVFPSASVSPPRRRPI